MTYLIRTTREKLLVRREEIISNLPMPYGEFKVKVNSDAPLSNDEWSAMTELEGIAFLLGENSNS